MKDGPVSLIEANGNVIGVVISGNSTSEHESGIVRLLHSLNIDKDGRFLEGRSMQAPCENRYRLLTYQKTNTYFPQGKKRIKVTEKAVALVPVNGAGTEAEVAKQHGNRYNQETDVAGAWDDREFCLVGWTDKGHEAVKLIAQGLEQGDLSVWRGGAATNPFDRSGLAIVRTTMVTDEQREQMRQADQAHIDLEEAARATGIQAKLDEVNHVEPQPGRPLMFHQRPRGYHALSPRMIDAEEMTKRNTRHNVVFYLNPHGQAQYNFGWFTVEELEQWIEGKGPVIKEPAQR